MKSLVRFALLFALIVVGKLAKQPEILSGTVKVEPVVNPITVKPVSFSRHATSEPATQANNSRLWHATAPVTTGATSTE